MGAFGGLVGLMVAILFLKAMLPVVIEALETEKARREKEQLKKEIAHLPPAERFHIQREFIDARPPRAEPMKAVLAPAKKGGGMGKFVVMALCAIYIISPIDFIPDVIPALGWGDDVVAGIIGLRALFK